MEHICWLNGFKSSKVQGIKWAPNHRAAARYAIDIKSFSWIFSISSISQGNNYCSIYCIYGPKHYGKKTLLSGAKKQICL